MNKEQKENVTQSELKESKHKDVGNYHIRIDGPHPGADQRHAHVSTRGGDEMLSVNRDGTAHHRSNHGKLIPRVAADALRQENFNVRPDDIVESDTKAARLLNLLNEVLDGKRP